MKKRENRLGEAMLTQIGMEKMLEDAFEYLMGTGSLLVKEFWTPHPPTPPSILCESILH